MGAIWIAIVLGLLAKYGYIMDRAKFEELVSVAVSGLPDEFAAKLENVDLVVQDWPTVDQLHRAGLRYRQSLLGLYEGVPQTRRGRHYGLAVPDKITIFQKPIEAKARPDKEIEMEIQKVVRHEIAHHFGSSEETLRRLEADKSRRNK